MIKKIFLHILIATVFIFPLFVSAQIIGGGGPQTPSSNCQPGQICNPLKNSDGSLMSLLVDILNKIIMPIAAVFCVMWIIYAGFQYVTAQGNEKKITAAHQNLLWALVGTGILLGAAGISKVVQNTIEALVKTT